LPDLFTAFAIFLENRPREKKGEKEIFAGKMGKDTARGMISLSRTDFMRRGGEKKDLRPTEGE